jgi:hypothetical protein
MITKSMIIFLAIMVSIKKNGSYELKNQGTKGF